MLSEYLKKEKLSIYSLSKRTGIPYSTLSDLCNGKVEIDNCKVSILIKLSEALDIDIKKLYKICKNNNFTVKVDRYDTVGKIVVRNKKYYVEYNDGDKVADAYLFKVNTTNNKYVKEAAEWILEDKLIDKEMEDLYVIQSNEKR